MFTQGVGCSSESSKSNADKYSGKRGNTGNQVSAQKDHKIVVFYFYGNRRCFSCKKIEALTAAAIKEGFSQEIEKGVLEFKPVNIETPGNQHFIKDYRLYSKSVIVSDMVKDSEERWKNLQRVWELLYREGAFKGYIQEEIREYLNRKAS
jgi:hypothetical protein